VTKSTKTNNAYMLTRLIESKISKRTIHCDAGAKKRSGGIKW
jgi:hypothetical protein